MSTVQSLTANASSAVAASAIERASARTGADFDYLLRTAVRESSLDPNAKARTSSAAGLFQFVEQTWLGMVKRHGDEHGLGQYADAISQNRNGRYVVADRQMRRDILALRYDAEVSAVMAAEFTEESASTLRRGLGREPTDGELYAAHFMGPAGALDLIQASARGEPSAAALFPDAARANRTIFYAKSGVARTPGEVLALLDSKHTGAKVPDLPDLEDMPASAILAGFRPSIDQHSAPEVPALPSDMRLARIEPDAAQWSPMQRAVIMSPVMAQLLAALDPIPERNADPIIGRRTDRDETRPEAIGA